MSAADTPVPLDTPAPQEGPGRARPGWGGEDRQGRGSLGRRSLRAGDARTGGARVRIVRLRGPLLGAVLGWVVSLALLAASSLGLFQSLEWMALDARFLLRARLAPGEREHTVTVIALDERAMRAFGSWPWPRNIQAGVIEFVLEAEPSVLGVAVVYSEFSADARHDRQLAEAFAGEIPVVLAALKEGETELLPQVTFLSRNVSIGHLNAPPDADGIVRRIPLRIETRDGPVSAFAWKMAERLLGRENVPVPPVDGENRFLINYLLRGASPALERSGLAQTIPVTDVIEGRNLERVRGKPAILAVTVPGLGASEERLTALRPLGPVPQAYIHANALAAILEGAHLKSDPAWDVAILLVLGALSGALAFGLRPWWSTLALGGLAAGFGGFALWQFVAEGRVVAVVAPAATLFSLYFSGLWYAHRRAESEARKVRAIFERYVTPEVVRALLSQPGAADLHGGRRQVTVLFADIRGFTAFAEQKPPELVVQVLNRYLSAMAEAVLLHGGMVDKFLGDGIMALFGAPLPDEAHADAAVRAALELLRRVNELGPWGEVAPAVEAAADEEPAPGRQWAPAGAASPWAYKLSVGIGIHTGEVIVGSIGSPKRMEYTAIGDAVNVAARLQELAPPGDIILSESVVEALSDGLRNLAEPLPPSAVRGRSAPVALFGIASHRTAGAVAGGVDRSLEGGPGSAPGKAKGS